ncbi:MAG: 3,4-dihydroxy-2-butanone-4-phosphate synthase [Armatimonadota bacterium]
MYDIERATADVRVGRLVIVTDDADREDEGDLILAAEHATGERVNLMLRQGGGLLLVALTQQRLAELDLQLIQPRNAPPHAPRMALPVDARHGVGTGISAADRATTIRKLAAPEAGPEDFAVPGHVLVLAAAAGGLRERRGHTECALELMLLAGLYPAAAMCEVMTPDGRMARGEELAALAQRIGVGIVGVSQIAEALGGA